MRKVRSNRLEVRGQSAEVKIPASQMPCAHLGSNLCNLTSDLLRVQRFAAQFAAFG